MSGNSDLKNIRKGERMKIYLKQWKGLSEVINSLIPVDNILNLQTKVVLNGYWTDLVPLSASSTGKHHHSQENGQFGLINHLIRTAIIGKGFINVEQESDDYEIIQACLLHDLGKLMTNKVTHGEWSVRMVEKYNLSDRVKRLIGKHMSKWSETPATQKDEYMLSWADYTASRKFLDFNMK